MRTGVTVRTMFRLAAISLAGEIATDIHLVEVRFKGDTRLDGVDLKKCAADLKSRTYVGPQWTDSLLERVRVQYLQDKGYFKAAVKASTQQLPDRQDTHQFVITFDIDAGPQYPRFLLPRSHAARPVDRGGTAEGGATSSLNLVKPGALS